MIRGTAEGCQLAWGEKELTDDQNDLGHGTRSVDFRGTRRAC